MRGDTLPAWTPESDNEDDDMGDSFSVAGDTVNHHYHQPPPPAPSQTEASTPSNASPLAKTAMIAAGLLGGAGVGAAVPWMLGAYEREGGTTTIEKRQDMGVGIDVVEGGAFDDGTAPSEP